MGHRNPSKGGFLKVVGSGPFFSRAQSIGTPSKAWQTNVALPTQGHSSELLRLLFSCFPSQPTTINVSRPKPCWLFFNEHGHVATDQRDRKWPVWEASEIRKTNSLHSNDCLLFVSFKARQKKVCAKSEGVPTSHQRGSPPNQMNGNAVEVESPGTMPPGASSPEKPALIYPACRARPSRFRRASAPIDSDSRKPWDAMIFHLFGCPNTRFFIYLLLWVTSFVGSRLLIAKGSGSLYWLATGMCSGK